ALERGQRGRPRLGLGAGSRRATASVEQTIDVLAALGVRGTELPVPKERGGCSQPDLGFTALGCPAQGGTKIAALRVEPPQPAHLLGAEESGLGPLGEREIEARMSTADRLTVAVPVQTLERKLPDRLEQSEAGLFVARPPGRNEIVGQERLDAVHEIE